MKQDLERNNKELEVVVGSEGNDALQI